MPKVRPVLTTLALLLTTGCGDAGGSATESAGSSTAASTGEASTGGPPTSTDADPTDGAAAPTYWQDVAPIYFTKCGACHQAGGIAPFVLTEYATAKSWAAPSSTAVVARTMPPWLVRDDGTCGVFQDSKALAADEIAVIEAWAAGGALEGTPRTDLELPVVDHLAAGLDLATPKFVPEIVGGDLAPSDEYRCFLADQEFAADTFLVGYEVVPGNTKIVHHVLGIVVDPAADRGGGKTNADVIAELDAQSPDRDGWPCFGAAGEGVAEESIPVTWAPGMGVVHIPADTGYRIKAGSKVVIQVHYNLADPAVLGQSDVSTMRLATTDSVPSEGFFSLPDPFLDSASSDSPEQLEPGQASVKYSWELPVGLYLASIGYQETDLYGVFPHMHQRGRKMTIELVDGNESRCAGDVQRWDFGWQLYYFYAEPLKITPSTVLKVTCEYNTLGDTEPVLPGWGTRNEMCLAGVYAVPRM
jgi:hypothetical protein